MEVTYNKLFLNDLKKLKKLLKILTEKAQSSQRILCALRASAVNNK